MKVTASFPEPCRFVLESFRELYRYDTEAREQGMAAEQRLAFHQEHSKPVMDKLHAWLGETRGGGSCRVAQPVGENSNPEPPARRSRPHKHRPTAVVRGKLQLAEVGVQNTRII